MSQFGWVYTSGEQARRVLLLQNKAESEAKDMRKLGALAVAQLQAKKADDVEIVAEGVSEEQLAVFYNSFHLSNYEFSAKTAPEPKKEDENADERLKKWKK